MADDDDDDNEQSPSTVPTRSRRSAVVGAPRAAPSEDARDSDGGGGGGGGGGSTHGGDSFPRLSRGGDSLPRMSGLSREGSSLLGSGSGGGASVLAAAAAADGAGGGSGEEVTLVRAIPPLPLDGVAGGNARSPGGATEGSNSDSDDASEGNSSFVDKQHEMVNTHAPLEPRSSSTRRTPSKRAILRKQNSRSAFGQLGGGSGGSGGCGSGGFATDGSGGASGDSGGRGAMRLSLPVVTGADGLYYAEHLQEELEQLMEAAELTALPELSSLPEMMRKDLDFGLRRSATSARGSSADAPGGCGRPATAPSDVNMPGSLDPNQFELWRERVASWLATTKCISELKLDPKESVTMHAERMHGISDALLPILQRCTAVEELKLHRCVLSNAALTSMCQVMKDRLIHLDLQKSTGFDEIGLKAIAAYCAEVRAA